VIDIEELRGLNKAVIIGAPHTSNWDFPIMLMAVLIMRLPVNWIGKHTLFTRGFGPLMRFLGGIAIDRRQKQNFVSQVADKFSSYDELFIVVAPEGTRKAVQQWRTGFYYMAYSAKVPIVLAYVDYAKKTIGVLSVETPSGDADSDIAHYQRLYKDVVPKNPQNDFNQS
jgi:1-acyl-sn-glycerol-3-phosphate acyltransferase